MMSKRDALRSYRRQYKRAYDTDRNPLTCHGFDHFSADFVEMCRRGDRVAALIGDQETEPYGAVLTTADMIDLQEEDSHGQI